MTEQECISRFNLLHPHGLDDELLRSWLYELEKTLDSEIYSHYENAALPENALSVPDEYAELYISYLQAKADYYSCESGRYLNSMNMFNSLLSAFADSFNRTHTPIQRAVIT